MESKMRFAILALLALSSFWCEAQCPPRNVLFFANGMFNSRGSAQNSLDKLLGRIHETASWKRTQSHLAYNYDEPTVLQLLEVMEQKSKDWNDHFLPWLLDIGDSPKWFRDIVARRVREMNEDGFSIPTQLEHEQLYVSELEKGRGVVVVAHSQGNFFANRASVNLQAYMYPVEDFFQIVGVANPSKYSDEGKYFTLQSDGVIRLIPDALPANISNLTPAPGLFDHRFVDHYLNGIPTGGRIVSTVENVMEAMAKKSEIYEAENNECNAWYETLNLPEKPEACILKCGSAMRDFSNFNCLSCEQYCQCKEDLNEEVN